MPPTVMVVDDDGDILDMTRLMLESGGRRRWMPSRGQAPT